MSRLWYNKLFSVYTYNVLFWLKIIWLANLSDILMIYSILKRNKPQWWVFTQVYITVYDTEWSNDVIPLKMYKHNG